MERFKFRFASLLKIRKAREDDALRGLSVAQKTLQREFENKNRLVLELQRSLLRRERLGESGVAVSSIRTEDEYTRGTKHRIILADHAITRAKRGVEKALRFYLNARRQSHVLEVLREKAFQEYKKLRMKLEQKNADELVTMRAHLTENWEDAE